MNTCLPLKARDIPFSRSGESLLSFLGKWKSICMSIYLLGVGGAYTYMHVHVCAYMLVHNYDVKRL